MLHTAPEKKKWIFRFVNFRVSAYESWMRPMNLPFPRYYDPLYFPQLFPRVFETPGGVCEWLRNAFGSESGWSEVRATYVDGAFLVENTSYDLRVFLTVAEIEDAAFHPRTYYKVSYPTLPSNPSWLYRTSGELKDAFEGITVKRRDEAIDVVVSMFMALARQFITLSDRELAQLRRWMCFELFREKFRDKVFPKIIRPAKTSYPLVHGRGNGLLRSIDPELDTATFRSRTWTMPSDLLKSTLLRVHYSRRSCSFHDKRAVKIELLQEELSGRWRQLLGLPAPIIGDLTNAYTSSISLNSTFGVLDLLELEYRPSFCNRVIAPMRDRHRKGMRKVVRRKERDNKEKSIAQHFNDIERAWPQVVDTEMKLECAHQYMEGMFAHGNSREVNLLGCLGMMKQG
ncbi:uncharacterized protein EV420DRAFT_1752696 [Desarmillaria tabescens]|uniref:Uncharacterized protein n=1 Tax=Armillaria tabescens TaxID=1929756 RepID=A0AA39JET5_ARMTA|nr:uncharacterized protein EV420DRAFT_1752696 [Desarmillaria tabescens]KAK0440471.1 hypothetical protein EV420DRAFT_1752696 [Desarmillaria tabescens]